MNADAPLTPLAAAQACAEALRVDPTDPGTARLALALGDALATEPRVAPVTRTVALRLHCSCGRSLAVRKDPRGALVPGSRDPYRPFFR